MRDTEARRRIEAAARQLVVERYDWSAVARISRKRSYGGDADAGRRVGRPR